MKHRFAGINIPVSSLRSKQSLGCGELLDLIPLIDWASEAGLSVIQILPIYDTSITKTQEDARSYSILSAFALHPIYLRLQALDKDLEEIEPLIHELNAPKLHYTQTYFAKIKLLRTIYAKRGEKDLATKGFHTFFEKHRDDLMAYAAFSILRDRFETSEFEKWPEHSAYTKEGVAQVCEDPDAAFLYFVQYHLHRQLKEVHTYAKSKGVLLKGDFPMGMHPFSVEAWRFPQYFRKEFSIGAPPDFYNEAGQNWGFPSYDWEAIEREDFAWLKKRLAFLEPYFDLMRIDHVLGYFRLWEIPKGTYRGLMGTFYPARGYDTIPEPEKLTSATFSEDVCFFKRRGEYHPRIDCKKTKCFQKLPSDLQKEVLSLHDEYYLRRQDALWKEEGEKKLKCMQESTKMVLCAEDIGVVPICTEEVLDKLQIPGLHVQRMPKSFSLEFEDTEEFPTLCVCTPSNHDTATLRQWWEEDPARTKRYYQTILRKMGAPPEKLTGDLAREVIRSHLDSKARYAIFLLQDLVAMSESIRFPDPKWQRINDPSIPEKQWTWRMHLYVEELLLAGSFTQLVYHMVQEAKR